MEYQGCSMMLQGVSEVFQGVSRVSGSPMGFQERFKALTGRFQEVSEGSSGVSDGVAATAVPY